MYSFVIAASSGYVIDLTAQNAMFNIFTDEVGKKNASKFRGFGLGKKVRNGKCNNATFWWPEITFS